MLPSVQEYHRTRLRLEYAVNQLETIIEKDPVRFHRLQSQLRDNKRKIEKLDIILSGHPENPKSPDEQLQLKRYIIEGELTRIEGGSCSVCTYYLPNRIRAEHGYVSMVKRLEMLPKETVSCIPENTKLSQPTRSLCDSYAEDSNALRDDDLKELPDRIATWRWLQVKYSSPQPAAKPLPDNPAVPDKPTNPVHKE